MLLQSKDLPYLIETDDDAQAAVERFLGVKMEAAVITKEMQGKGYRVREIRRGQQSIDTVPDDGFVTEGDVIEVDGVYLRAKEDVVSAGLESKSMDARFEVVEPEPIPEWDAADRLDERIYDVAGTAASR